VAGGFSRRTQLHAVSQFYLILGIHLKGLKTKDKQQIAGSLLGVLTKYSKREAEIGKYILELCFQANIF
jgi:hypothetical protein